jgi:hypothetical protein
MDTRRSHIADIRGSLNGCCKLGKGSEHNKFEILNAAVLNLIAPTENKDNAFFGDSYNFNLAFAIR